jgi:hypothetical protein
MVDAWWSAKTNTVTSSAPQFPSCHPGAEHRVSRQAQENAQDGEADRAHRPLVFPEDDEGPALAGPSVLPRWS